MFKLLKIERGCLVSNQTVCHGAQLDVTQWRRTGIFKISCFRNEGHYRSGDLSSVKFLGIFSHGDSKNFAGLAHLILEFYVVEMKTSYRVQYGDVILVTHRETPIWRPDVKENIQFFKDWRISSSLTFSVTLKV